MTMNTKKKFLPIIIGTDLNAYTMSASFYEKYQIKPVLIGKIPMRFTEGSSLIQNIHYHSNLTDPDTFKTYLVEIAHQYHQEYDSLILIGTNDIYVNMIIDHQDFLKDYYLFNYITQDLRDQLFYKKNFYQLCEQHGLDTPKTYFYNCEEAGPIPTDFDFPIVVKPSNVVEYQQKGLHLVNKLYFLNSQEELERTLKEVVDGGYKDEMIIQDYIPGGDTNMWDSVYYGNTEGTPQLITLAQVLLQERASHLIGAYTALIVRYDEAFMKKLADFLANIGYTGFANFDIKRDPRDGKLKVFEVNIRQGRSSSYISYNGHHLAEYFVDDLIYHKERPFEYFEADFLYSVLPNFVVKQNIEDPKLKEEVTSLMKQKKVGNPLISKEDKGFKRKVQMHLRRLNYYTKYRQ